MFQLIFLSCYATSHETKPKKVHTTKSCKNKTKKETVIAIDHEKNTNTILSPDNKFDDCENNKQSKEQKYLEKRRQERLGKKSEDLPTPTKLSDNENLKDPILEKRRIDTKKREQNIAYRDPKLYRVEGVERSISTCKELPNNGSGFKF